MCLQLEVVGPGGPPDGHGDEDDEHHHWFRPLPCRRVFHLFHIFIYFKFFIIGIKKYICRLVKYSWKCFWSFLEQILGIRVPQSAKTLMTVGFYFCNTLESESFLPFAYYMIHLLYLWFDVFSYWTFWSCPWFLVNGHII